ncbi:EAL domain-containing protein [Novosphingobium sp. B 225]|uniref:EAL domain-containing protein n=1 Tax=Novosphingobium sp. B 225 TaxID=1961849 RepID=UPI001C3DCEC3|nr:EAL domain-containing protein [Novosphingobium sp. B 225]
MTLIIVLLGVLTQSLQAFDHVYWNVWFKNRVQSAPTSTVLLSLDNGNLAAASSASSSTGLQAKLVEFVRNDGAKQVYLDSPRSANLDPAGDAALNTELKKAGKQVLLVKRSKPNAEFNNSAVITDKFVPPPGTPIAVSNWSVNFLGFAEHAQARVRTEIAEYPSVSAADSRLPASANIYPDFRFDPDSVPVVAASDVLAGRLRPGTFTGKRVFITNTSLHQDTVLGYFGHRDVPAALVDIAGYHGLRMGHPSDVGWLPLLALVLVTIFATRRVRNWKARAVVYCALAAVSLALPGVLREANVIISVGPAYCAFLAYAPLRSSHKWRNRVQQTSSASGLPNISAMTDGGIPPTKDVIAVSINQYEQILASLPRELHGDCARQIARRLSFGGGDRAVFDNDNGLFVWLEDSQTLDSLVEHLEGLRALFSSPLVISGHVLDTNVHFGIDRNVQAKPMSRIKSAIASAQEAQGKGKLYEEFGEQRLAESSWELSLHARIDEGLRNGDIWLALQPQYDFRTNRLSGAEALIRWNDPKRGVIPPDAFILQAERAGRIEAITYWVLEKSIAMLADFNAVAGPFQISVNLSARMVDHPALVQRVADIVRETRLEDCGLITFEVTETFSMTNREQAKRNLASLRAMGFRLSIDDFGTGQASLAYLAEIPSDEVKLDRRFIQAITTDERERLIVESVIGLAHALGQEVVAEGIEDIVTLGVLRDLQCDLAQGYHIGRPMRPEDLLDLLDTSQAGTPGRLAVNL